MSQMIGKAGAFGHCQGGNSAAKWMQGKEAKIGEEKQGRAFPEEKLFH